MEVNELESRVRDFAEAFQRVKGEVEKVIVGHHEIVEGVLTALFAGGHVLLEGLPGLGKTRLVQVLSQAIDLAYTRIQFTPDLMPADIVGTNILSETEQGRRIFVFQPGPIFSNLILADEINRATPKTQSAMLEAMQEGSVTVSGETRMLSQPFLVLATQNPIELEGTYPLPEAQLDRFLVKLLVPRSELEDLVTILDRTTGGEVVTVEKVVSRDELLALRALALKVPAARGTKEYAARLVLATHPDHELAPKMVQTYGRFGASPRGAQGLLLCSKVLALANGRYNVAIDDIKRIAKPVLRHRVLLNYDGEASGVTSDQLLEEILK